MNACFKGYYYPRNNPLNYPTRVTEQPAQATSFKYRKILVEYNSSACAFDKMVEPFSDFVKKLLTYISLCYKSAAFWNEYYYSLRPMNMSASRMEIMLVIIIIKNHFS